MKGEIFKEVIKVLINEKKYVTVDNLAKKFDVSAKTIRNYIASKEFKGYLGQCTVEKKQNKGIKIVGDNRHIAEVIRKIEIDNETKENRDEVLMKEYSVYILKQLLSTSKRWTIQEFCRVLYKSENSISKDINEIKEWISRQNINLISKSNYGMFIEGDERDIRRAYKLLAKRYIFDRLQESANVYHNEDIEFRTKAMFKDIDIEFIKKTINIAESVLNNKFTDNDNLNLVIKLSILISRIKIDKTVKGIYKNLERTKEFLASQLVSLNLENKFNINIGSSEINEIARYMISARKQMKGENGKDGKEVDEIISLRFVKELSNNLGINISDDECLIKSLLQHLKPAIRRLKLGAQSDNPLLEKIRYQYTDIYVAVLSTIQVIEHELDIEFDVNELGYICLHIAAAIHRKENGSYLNCILVCNSGITIIKYLESIIESKITDIKIIKSIVSDEGLESELEKYDLILDTTSIVSAYKEKLINISDIFEENDYKKVESWIVNKQLDELQRYCKNNDEIMNRILLFDDDLESREKVLRKYGNIIEELGYAVHGFSNSLIDRERKASTAVGRNVAVPHGYNEYVKLSSLLIIRLTNKINWNGQLVDLVFIFTPNTKDSSKNKYFFRNLYNVIRNDETIAKIRNAESISEIREIFIK